MKSSQDHFNVTVQCLRCSVYRVNVWWWKNSIGFSLFILSESLQSTSQRKTRRRQAVCDHKFDCLEQQYRRCRDSVYGDQSLSLHSLLQWAQMIPPSPPLRGPHLITHHHSHLACVPFQLSAQFLSDDPREPHAHWPRLESSNRSFFHPSRFFTPTPHTTLRRAPSYSQWPPDEKQTPLQDVTWRATYD